MIKRFLAFFLLIAMLLPMLPVTAMAQPNEKIDQILGYYEGAVGNHDVHAVIVKTEDLIADNGLLQHYVDQANQWRNGSGWEITAEPIAQYLLERTQAYDVPYTCLLYLSFFADGLWVMNVSYSEENDTYKFGGGEHFPEPYYGYIRTQDMTFRDGVLSGPAYTGAFSEDEMGQMELTRKDQLLDPATLGTMEVYADHTNLHVEFGDTITLTAAVTDGEGNPMDPAGITFQMSDRSFLQVTDNGIADDQFYLKLRADAEGITYVTFSDSATGETVSVPITVIENNQRSYTLSNVPEFQVGELTTNFYNFSGMYIDNYSYVMSDDKKALVRFDVYNTNYIYGMVEIYNKDGELENAVLINKMTGYNTSIKKIFWDGPRCKVRDLRNKNTKNYRAEFECSVKTPVQVEIPENGYIKITIDPMESNLLGIVNSADYTMAVLSLIGKLNNFSAADAEFPKKLTMSLVKDTAFAQLRKDGNKIFTKIDKDLTKEIVITPTAIGDFTDTLSKQLEELKVMDVVKKSLKDSGADFAEDVLKKLMGVFGVALDGVFIIGKAENLALAYIDYIYAFDDGAIRLQNQGGGLRAASQVRLESDVDFDPEVAAQVYAVALDEDLLKLVKNADQETYEMLTQGIMHTYNISLVKNGEAVQHSDDVTVHIPIPKDLWPLSLTGNVSVYRIEEDGTLTDMHAVVDGGTIRFDTDHFSLYAVVGNTAQGEKNPPKTPAEETAPKLPFKQLLPIVLILAAVLAAGVTAAVLLRKKKRA